MLDSKPIPQDAAVRTSNPSIGVFDSGIGGLSVLRELCAALPSASMLYLADAGHAPYGERGDAFVVERSLRIAEHLVNRGASLLVVACNTATAAAVQTLRQAWPNVHVVGVEPGVKPAVAATRNSRIGVLATPGTLASEKFRRLIHREAKDAQLTLQPCPGLAALIERGDFDSAELASAVKSFCEPLQQADVDTVVLGCTHYAFVRIQIQRALGAGVTLIDTADAVARRAAYLFSSNPAGEAGACSITLQTTGDTARLRAVATALFRLPFNVEDNPLL